MKYGHFDDARREYVITQPDTPLPWINYMGSQNYFGLISNTAGGYSFYRDARLRRLTRYRYNNVPGDVGGRYIYLRDNANGTYWSPSWQPVRTALDDYTCRHGMGYTTISGSKDGLKTETRYFVPLNETLEIWQTTVTNERDEAATLSLFPLVEFCLWDANDDMTNFQRNLNIGEVEINIEGEAGIPAAIYHKTEYRERRDHFASFACSVPVAGYDTQREAFLGAYHGYHEPQAVINGAVANSHAHGWSPIAAYQIDLTLNPGESREIIFVLGYHENPRDKKFDPPGSSIINKQNAQPVIAKYLDAAHVNAAFDTLKAHWDNLLSIMQVSTPDEHTNRMVNVWNAYQNMITFNMSRSASYYESGIGRGMGFRDSSQDLMGFVQMVPERARERILDIAATQLPNGGAYHQYQPLTKRGNDAVGGNFNDDPLWLVIGTGAYIRETGDWSILKAMVPYDNKDELATPLYDHLQRSMQYTLDRLGPHGLPLIGRADWNDCLNLNTFSDEPGESFQTYVNPEIDGLTAESVFIAGLFNLAANEMVQMAEVLGEKALADGYRAAAAEIDATVWTHGWDGAWFKRAYDHYGNPVGSSECDTGKIFIEPQGMCVMGGMGLEDGRARKALDAVAEHLATDHGIVILQPAYQEYHLNLGEISSYPPGYKENAGIFCHNNPWIMIAEAMLGNGGAAFDYYSRINPSARETISDVHRCEPYVYAQMIAGKDAPSHGEAKNSWLTGTASWNFTAITQWILGIRPGFTGLIIAPAIPADWDGFTVKRRYQGVDYNISIQRQGPGNAISLTIDGQVVEGNVIPLDKVAGKATVDVAAVIH